jgi:hypothetical protein
MAEPHTLGGADAQASRQGLDNRLDHKPEFYLLNTLLLTGFASIFAYPPLRLVPAKRRRFF